MVRQGAGLGRHVGHSDNGRRVSRGHRCGDDDARDPATVAAFARFSPLHRLASTDEIQGLALFLASPASSYVTGSQIVIDGGVLLGLAD